MASALALVPWIFSFLCYMVLVAGTMFEIISLSDLETDYINPSTLARRLNPIQVPLMLLHAGISLWLLLWRRWLFVLLNLPLLLYNAREYRRGLHLIDQTEVFKEISSLQSKRIIKLIFYIVLVLCLMFRLILAAFEEP